MILWLRRFQTGPSKCLIQTLAVKERNLYLANNISIFKLWNSASFSFFLKGKIKELEDSLSKLLASKHKLESLKNHLPPLQAKIICNLIVEIDVSIINMRKLLEMLYKEDGIMEHLMNVLGNLRLLRQKGEGIKYLDISRTAIIIVFFISGARFQDILYRCRDISIFPISVKVILVLVKISRF